MVKSSKKEDMANQELIKKETENNLNKNKTGATTPANKNKKAGKSPKSDNKKFLKFIPAILVLIVALTGATLFTPKLVALLEEYLLPTVTKKPEYRLDAPSEVLPLALKSAKDRDASLKVIAMAKEASLDRARAKYLLASDILRKDFDGAKALEYLKNLDYEYPILAPYVLLREGRAYELTNDTEKAQEIWLELIEKHPDSLVVADAYYKLGKYDEKYWQEAIDKLPQHPRTQSIARELLKKNPSEEKLLLLLAQYDISPQTKPILEKLTKDYADKLTPEQWAMIGNNHWRNTNYAQANVAYQKANSDPENLYRLARTYHVTDKKAEAKQGYKKLIETFPNTPQAGLALRRIASLSSGQEAVDYLNKVDDKYPTHVSKALVEKIKLLTKLGKYDEANTAQNVLLQKYTNTDEAANYRWNIANKLAKTNNYISAWQWAQQISVNNPDSAVAPKAAFWVAKWAEKLGQAQEAQTVYKYVLDNHPTSYYAWRSAVKLGQPVGDFTNVRGLDLKVETPDRRPIPPAGSNTFKELFLLGEDTDAIDLFNAEIAGKDKVSVSEQFTQGLLKQVQGQYLQSINLIWGLSKRDEPQDYSEWQILRQSPEYWQALFPFPYEDLVVKYSKERNLNPFLVISLIRQESRFEKEIKSPVGATGLMQIMPATGAWIAPQIGVDKDKYSLTNPEDNVKMGTWYLNYTHETYNNNSMLAIASYNAGPGNVSNWLERYSLQDFDEFVENIPFPETKGYVETVFSNYWNYVRLYQPQIENNVEPIDPNTEPQENAE